MRRHLIALRAAMAEFGEDFDLDEFRAAYDTDEPAHLNQVKRRAVRAWVRGGAGG